MNKLVIFSAILACWLFVVVVMGGCTAIDRAERKAWSKPHTVEMYNGGILVHTWVSVGKVHNESDSDGYRFMDKETGKLVRVSGDIVVTVQ